MRGAYCIQFVKEVMILVQLFRLENLQAVRIALDLVNHYVNRRETVVLFEQGFFLFFFRFGR